jgi:hypothetical protein
MWAGTNAVGVASASMPLPTCSGRSAVSVMADLGRPAC